MQTIAPLPELAMLFDALNMGFNILPAAAVLFWKAIDHWLELAIGSAVARCWFRLLARLGLKVNIINDIDLISTMIAIVFVQYALVKFLPEYKECVNVNDKRHTKNIFI
jgi:hypothetical protein